MAAPAAPPAPSAPPPPGWYPDPWGPGGSRWWDGRGWGREARPGVPTAPAPAAAAGRPVGPPLRDTPTGWWRRPWVVVVAVVAVLAVVGAATGAGRASPSTRTPAAAATTTATGPAAPAAPAAPTTQHVVYRVTGTAATADVTVWSPSGLSQPGDVPLPYETAVDVPSARYALIAMGAQVGAGGGSVTCEVEVDGVVAASNTASGAYALATCNP